MLKVHGPYQLLEKDGERIPSYGALGSINTCMVVPGQLDLVLAVALPPPIVRIHFKDRQGNTVRSLANACFAGPDGSNSQTPIGPDGTLFFAHDPEVFRSNLLTAFMDGYRCAHVPIHDATAFPLSIVLDESSGTAVTIRVQDGQGKAIEDLEIYVQPILEGEYPEPELFVGRTDGEGVLRIDSLAELSYHVLSRKERVHFTDRSLGTPLGGYYFGPLDEPSGATLLAQIRPRAGEDQFVPMTLG